jgi:uncharacterized protein (UPF0335 family)
MTANLDNAGAALIQYVERIERLTEEAEAITSDRKEVYDEAKSSGFDTAILRRVIALRKIPKAERDERDALIDTYMAALDKMEKQAVRESEEAGA